jgi:unsaturated rhamnogalacturonyl hydrolase
MSGSERRIAEAPNRREFLTSMGTAGIGSLIVGCQQRARPGAETVDPSVPDPRGFGEIEIPDEIAPIDAPFRMPDLSRPTFPDRTIDIRDHGAEAGRDTTDTEAINAAISACHEAGGGRVVIPEGDWQSGTIRMASNVDLHIEDGATVHFIQDVEAYLPPVLVREEGVESYNLSPLIYARDVENIAITGTGTFDGKWSQFWEEWYENTDGGGDRVAAAKVPLEERDYGWENGGIRPNFVVPFNARNVLIEGPSFVNSPMWNLQPTYCENVIIRDVTIDNQSANGDGVVVDSSKNVLVEYIEVRSGDDAVVMKSGLNEDGRIIDVPTRNVVIRNFTAKEVRTGSGGVVFGSETSGGIHDVYVTDAYFEGTDKGIRFKTAPRRGSYVTNITVEGVRMKDVEGSAMNFNLQYNPSVSGFTMEDGGPSEANGRFAAPRLFDLQFKDIYVDGVPRALETAGHKDQPIRELRLENAVFRNVEQGIELEWLDGVHLERVEVQSENTPLALKHVHNVHLESVSLSGSTPHLVVEESQEVYRDGSQIAGADQ